MRKFLLLISTLSFSTCRKDYYGFLVWRDLPNSKKTWHEEKYTKYPREMTIFQDDNYSIDHSRNLWETGSTFDVVSILGYFGWINLQWRPFWRRILNCRTALGLSYQMILGTPAQPLSKVEYETWPFMFSRPYFWYPTKNYQWRSTFCDYDFEDTFTGIRGRPNYVSYMEIPFDHMTVVDGLINEGEFARKYIEEEDSVWVAALTRFFVNYSMDGNNWITYRNRNGKMQEFVLGDINHIDGTIVPMYTKFEPRITARKIRIVPLSYRTKLRLYVCFVMELFGCDYEPENMGLQRGFRKRTDMVVGRTTLYPWQLNGASSGLSLDPINQAFMALSRVYHGKDTILMPDETGWCANSHYRYFDILLLQDDSFHFKYTPIKAVYPTNPKSTKDLVGARWMKEKDCKKKYWHYLNCLMYRELIRRKEVSSRHMKIKILHSTLRTTIDLTEARKSPCVQDLGYSGLSITPRKIKRSKGCSAVLLPFRSTYCHKGKTSATPYMEIDLKKVHILDSFSFKGHQRSIKRSWVSSLAISYSTDKIIWMSIKERYAPDSVLLTNKNQYDTTRILLNPRLRARYLRIVPLSGHGGLCMRVQIRGCSKEPWILEQRKLKRQAEKIGFGLWLIVLTDRLVGAALPIDCFVGKTKHLEKFGGTQQIYEVIHNKEYPWKYKYVYLTKSPRVRFFKCVARNKQGGIVSSQLYIIPSYGQTGFILPVQEMGLMYNGGMPILDFPGTMWSYEPYIGKLTFLFFPDMTYYYTYFGEYYDKVLDYFSLTVLGKGKTIRNCLNLAVHQHHRYFVMDPKKGECLSSWYLPLAAKNREYDLGKAARKNKIYEIYRIRQVRKPYLATWYGPWNIGSYKVKKHVSHDNPIFASFPYGNGKFRFHFDSYITTNGYDSHTLVIKNFIVDDVKEYSLSIHEMETPKRRFSRAVELRHIGEPHLNLSLHMGSCINNPLRIIAVPVRREYLEAEEWNVEWRKIVNGKPIATGMETSDPFELYAKKASLRHNGQYRIRVKNRYGYAEAFTYVGIVARLPTISSITPSPHTAVEDTSDVLQMSVANEEDLISLEWEFNGKPISVNDKHYSFPGEVIGKPQTRKILKLSNMHSGMSGTYKVTSKAKYCQFHKTVLVEVYVLRVGTRQMTDQDGAGQLSTILTIQKYERPAVQLYRVRPKLIVSPSSRTIYQISGGNTTRIKVVVAGGIPKPEIENLFWYKDNKPLQITEAGRVRIQTKPWMKKDLKGKRIGWNSTLIIRTPHKTDSGTYSFMVSFPRANYTIERVVKVTEIISDIIGIQKKY